MQRGLVFALLAIFWVNTVFCICRGGGGGGGGCGICIKVSRESFRYLCVPPLELSLSISKIYCENTE